MSIYIFLLLIGIVLLSFLSLIAKRIKEGVTGFKSLITPISTYGIGIIFIVAFYTETIGTWTFIVSAVLIMTSFIGLKFMKVVKA